MTGPDFVFSALFLCHVTFKLAQTSILKNRPSVPVIILYIIYLDLYILCRFNVYNGSPRVLLLLEGDIESMCIIVLVTQ